jgi:REP element-mobilizing transposase RayT
MRTVGTDANRRRAWLFDSERFKRHYVTTWQDLRAELSFRIIGYVLVPEHFHILLWPSDLANPSQIMQKLEDRTAKFVIKNLRQDREFAWCGRMLQRLELPPTVHHHAHHRVWQRRFYDFNMWSNKKVKEKLDDMHNNPVERQLVEKLGAPLSRWGRGDWPWSSWRLLHGGLLHSAMDRVP